MGLRLFTRWNRGSAPVGRHARMLPVVTVPGAAASLVGSAVRDPLVTGRGMSALDPVGEQVRWAPVPAPLPPTVGLVFADGESVELDEDDPRVRTFRAAAAALLEHTAT